MRVLVINAYNRDNAGDAALLSSAIAQIRAAYPSATVAFAGLEDPQQFPLFEGAQNVGSARRWVGDETKGRATLIVRKFAVAVVGLSASTRRIQRLVRRFPFAEPLMEAKAISESDLVVGLGGGYLNGTPTIAGTLNVLFLTLPILVATRLGVPVVLAPQSYGPFGNSLQRRLVRRTLSRANAVVAREDTSLQLLIDLAVPPELLCRGVDSAFTGSATWTRRAGTDRQLLVGMTVRNWLPAPQQQIYEEALAGFIDWAQSERDASVVLVPQVTSDYQGDDDRVASARVAALCVSRPQLIVERIEYAALRSRYAEFDVLVGTRFHSVIFALTSGVPAIAIEYEHKTGGIMRDLGLSEWVIPIASVRAHDLIRLFDRLLEERDNYRDHLANVLPAYRLKADGFIETLRNVEREPVSVG